MVHCNNGASELGTWAGVFTQFAAAIGAKADANAVFGALFGAALEGEADGGGLLAYNYLAGEPITGMAEGRPLVVRTPGSRLTLANFMRTQLYAAFGTLSLGMNVLRGEGVQLDSMFAHGGMFKTAGVAQRFLAAAIGAPVAVGDTASEGGAWGIAVLAEYLRTGEQGSRFRCRFCPVCGSLLFGTPDRERGDVNLYIGTLDDPSVFKPTCAIFVRSRAPWDRDANALPAHTALPLTAQY